MLHETIDLLVHIFALFPLFLRFISFNLLLLFLLISLRGLCQCLLVLLILLLDVLLHFGHIVLFLLFQPLGDELMIIDNVVTGVSHALLTELNWVLIVGNVLGVLVVIEMAVELNVLVAALILFLSVDFLHLLILFMLVLNHGVGLVLQVLTPHF